MTTPEASENPATPLASTAPPAAKGEAATVTISLDGETRSFEMPRNRTILDGAKAHGLPLPHSCRAAVCGECRMRLLKGTVQMKRNKALDESEIDAGFILTCTGYPTSDVIELSCDDKLR
ncbi:MAG: 2Fe-2S iron-sulfur cluster binding domain-containing protein [Gammaproteobacteria bacterium]|nr:2Fe-2S iron-sulfur cluster binding domain-containing protein [Gammaproteobacteria bacterium]